MSEVRPEESRTAQRLAKGRHVASGEGRVIGHRRAGSDQHGVGLYPPPVRACLGAVITARTRRGRETAVEGERELERQVGGAGGALMQERRAQRSGLISADAYLDLDAGLPQGLEPTPLHPLVGVEGGNHPGDAGSDESRGAGGIRPS